jgi:hypothetical protein
MLQCSKKRRSNMAQQSNQSRAKASAPQSEWQQVVGQIKDFVSELPVQPALETAADWSRLGVDTALKAQQQLLTLSASQTATSLELARQALASYEESARAFNEGVGRILDESAARFQSAIDRVSAAAK